MKGSEAFSRDTFAEFRAIPLGTTIQRLGLEVRGRGFAPCPSCGAERRGSADRRPPVQLYGPRWHCFRCLAGGDGIALVAWMLFGRALTSGDPAWPRLFEWYESAGAVSVDSPFRVGPVSGEANRPPPPAREVADLWGRSCLPVSPHSHVMSWLLSRHIDHAVVLSRDLARALRPRARMPGWARTRAGWWSETGHSLLLPAWSPAGQLGGLHARLVVASTDPAVQKALHPTGYSPSNLVLANGAARDMLDTSRDVSKALVARVLIVEGVPDYLTWATELEDSGSDGWAVFGIWQGGWTRQFAARVPDGTEVNLRLHDDAAGERYAANAVGTFDGRDVTLLRWAAGVREDP